MTFDDLFNYDFIFQTMTGKSKQKRKYTREPQLSENSRADSKRAKQDAVHEMVMTSLERKARSDVYGNVKNHI